MQEPESFQVLARRYMLDDERPHVEVVSFEGCMRAGRDPRCILAYLASLGLSVRAPEDLLRINQIGDEEELSAFQCAEGVAVGHASDGWWLLFTK